MEPAINTAVSGIAESRASDGWPYPHSKQRGPKREGVKGGCASCSTLALAADIAGGICMGTGEVAKRSPDGLSV